MAPALAYSYSTQQGHYQSPFGPPPISPVAFQPSHLPHPLYEKYDITSPSYPVPPASSYTGVSHLCSSSFLPHPTLTDYPPRPASTTAAYAPLPPTYASSSSPASSAAFDSAAMPPPPVPDRARRLSLGSSRPTTAMGIRQRGYSESHSGGGAPLYSVGRGRSGGEGLQQLQEQEQHQPLPKRRRSMESSMSVLGQYGAVPGVRVDTSSGLDNWNVLK